MSAHDGPERGHAPRSGGPGEPIGMLGLHELRGEVADGRIDTVIVAATDMQGRLVGKRVDGDFFLEEVAERGCEGCAYLVATDTEMNPVSGYEVVNWDTGYGDFVFMPDVATLRRIPWLEGTALVLCDLISETGGEIAPSPRQVLTAVYDRSHERGYIARAATELEFFVFRESYDQAWTQDYRDLTPTTPYSLDYHVLATSFEEPLVRQIRRGMKGAGIPVEFSKGEAWIAQHEINLRYADAVTTADRHVIYKNGVKEIAHLNGVSATFMAKPSESSIGSSCHVHVSLARHDGSSAFFDGEETDELRHFLGGSCRYVRELALLLAPSVNSYKRYVADSWAPVSLAWGRDNRSCAFRIVGHGDATRVECRIPGGDMNPYLGIAALLAAGLAGIEAGVDPPPEQRGSAYAEAGGSDRFPSSLHEAVDLWEASDFAREAFGDEVWAHYLNYGRTELRLFERAVTDYERRQMFERG